MAAALDMSLDDLIKTNKKSGSGNSRARGGRNGNRASGSGLGPAGRRFKNRGANRSAPYPAAKAPETTWQHDMFVANKAAAVGDGAGARTSSIETGTKLYVSNLDYGVSNNDLKELFSELGDLKRCSMHYDRSGRSKGMAEIVFSRRADAMAAVRRYNNVQLDGKPMKIEIVGTNIVTPALVPAASGSLGSANGVRKGSGQGRGTAPGRSRGRRRFARGRGQGGKTRGEKVSAEDLDADLDKYHSEAMQTN